MKIGILGAGQLARMLINAATPLGIDVICMDPSKEICTNNKTPHINADYEDLKAVDQFMDSCDIITFENENIPLSTALYIEQHKKPLFPSSRALSYTQDRLIEKTFLQSLNIPTALFHPVNDLASFKEATEILKFPLILKTRRLGYDGKGQYRIENYHEGEKIILQLSQNNTISISMIAEAVVTFKRELSIIVAGNSSEIVFYPITENHHKNGILRLSTFPTPRIFPKKLRKIHALAKTIMKTLDYRGVIAIELFETEEDILVNEIAPRVHNSGHWTIEGTYTSQFENHLRGIMNFSLGITKLKGYSVMFNAIGKFPDTSDLLKIPYCHLHDYQKTPRSGRKVGHVTLNTPSPTDLNYLLQNHSVLKNMLEIS